MLTFAHNLLFLLLPLPLLVRWLLPPFHTARPAVRLPFFAQVAELTGRRPEAGAAIQRRSAVQGIVYVVIWCAVRDHRVAIGGRRRAWRSMSLSSRISLWTPSHISAIKRPSV
jgi:hypothetical protein